MSDPDQDSLDGDLPASLRDGGRREAAHYIMGEIEQLGTLARRHQLDMLGYLLDMAKLEARELVGRRDEWQP